MFLGFAWKSRASWRIWETRWPSESNKNYESSLELYPILNYYCKRCWMNLHFMSFLDWALKLFSFRVFLENLVLWVRLDRGWVNCIDSNQSKLEFDYLRLNWSYLFSRESVEFLGREENWVQQVCRDLKEFLVHLVQMGQRYCYTP